MPTIKGKGVVWGSNGTTFTAGIVEATNAGVKESLRIVRDSDKFDFVDNIGDRIGQVFYNLKKTISATIVPYGTSTSQAQSSVAAWMLAPGTKITIVDGDRSATESYNCVSVTLNRTQTGLAMLDIEAELSEANDITGVIS